jgi:hypothetical protein
MPRARGALAVDQDAVDEHDGNAPQNVRVAPAYQHHPYAALWWWPEHGNIEFYKRRTLTLRARNAPLLHTSSRGSGVPLVLNWNTQSAGLSFVSVAKASRQMRAPSQIEKRRDNRGARCKRLQGPLLSTYGRAVERAAAMMCSTMAVFACA